MRLTPGLKLKTHTNGSYATGTGNGITSDGTWTYSYDDEGNITKKSQGTSSETWTYGYDHRNQMTLAQKWDKDPDLNGDETLLLEADYSYDVFGNRIEKNVDVDGDSTPDITVRYAYDGWKPGDGFIGNENWDVWGDFNSSDTLVDRYMRGDTIDQLFARIDDSGDPYWLLTDHLGSVRDVVDNTGTVVKTVAYDGYGNIISQSGAGSLGRYAWTGREIETETGLQYNRARYYDPAIGRWTSQDPLGFDAGDTNLYRYANNAPTIATDPSGKRLVTSDRDLAYDYAAWWRGQSGPISQQGGSGPGFPVNVSKLPNNYYELSLDSNFLALMSMPGNSKKLKEFQTRVNERISGLTSTDRNFYGAMATNNPLSTTKFSVVRTQPTWKWYSEFDPYFTGQMPTKDKIEYYPHKDNTLGIPGHLVGNHINEKFRQDQLRNDREEYLEQLNSLMGPTSAGAKREHERQLDRFQGALDIIGIIPVFGDGVDAINGVIYIVRGKYVDAGFSFAGILVPVSIAGGRLFKEAIGGFGDVACTGGSNFFRHGGVSPGGRMSFAGDVGSSLASRQPTAAQLRQWRQQYRSLIQRLNDAGERGIRDAEFYDLLGDAWVREPDLFTHVGRIAGAASDWRGPREVGVWMVQRSPDHEVQVILNMGSRAWFPRLTGQRPTIIMPYSTSEGLLPSWSCSP